MHKHLTIAERERISQMHYANASKTEIAHAVGCSRSTVYREIARNSESGNYMAVKAQSLAEKRRSNRPLVRKMDQPDVHGCVREGLSKYWSPEQIAGRMKYESQEPNKRVSRSTIERWIRSDAHQKHWESFLRRRGKRRPKDDRRGLLPSTVGIQGRPAAAERRERCGDWEGDTIVGPGKRSGLACCTDRRSGLLKLNKVSSLKSKPVIDKIRQQMRKFPEMMRRTMTFDNGKEFAQYARLAKVLPEGVFFARPGRPWERGTNENTNGLIRQFFPKGTNLAEVSHQQIKRIENLLNERPRKRHGYRTPNEVFQHAYSQSCRI